MARLFPKAAIYNLWRLDLFVAIIALHFAHIFFDRRVNGPALFMPEDHTRGLLLHVKQVKLPSELAVIALRCFF